MNAQSPARAARGAGTRSIQPPLLAVVVVLLSVAQAALAQGPDPCLSCHASQGLAITFRNSERVSGFVDANRLQASVHGALSCQVCHTDISMDHHPGGKSESTADFRQKASRACRTCHAEDRLKARPTHAFAAAPGATPPCAECHVGHAVTRVPAWKQSVAEKDYCLACHHTALSKTHRSGEVLPLQIDPASLAASVHNQHDCSQCHAGYARDVHPVSSFESGRQHSVLLAGACSACHADKAARVKGSVHSRGGAPGAVDPTAPPQADLPVCTDCHGFHTVGPKASYQTISGVPCRQCHEGVFATYEKSMHGIARANGEHRAPLCSSCHFAHEVGFAAASPRVRAACAGCHEGVEGAHEAWLPNAALHLDAIACSACHAPAAGKGIYLQVVDRQTHRPITEDRIREFLGTDAAGLGGKLDPHGEGIDSADLSFLLKQLNRRGADVQVGFVGRMDVNRYSDAHQLSLRSSAVKECESCHSKDSPFFKTVNLAVVKADGRLATFHAQPETLDSLRSAGVTAGFYVIGGTRVPLLDWLGALLVGVGALIPTGHVALRMMTARYRARRRGVADPPAEGGRHAYFHPLPVRVWHWFNAAVFVGLVFTGVALRYQDLGSLADFKVAVSVHNALGTLMVAGFVFWLCYYGCFGKLGLYVPRIHRRQYLRSVIAQARYYGFGIFRGEPSPHRASPQNKFNPLQQMAYFGVMLGLFPLQIATGILLMDIGRFSAVIEALGGLAVIDDLHVVVSFALVAFLFVHVYLVTLGATPLEHIRSMVTGYKLTRGDVPTSGTAGPAAPGGTGLC